MIKPERFTGIERLLYEGVMNLIAEPEKGKNAETMLAILGIFVYDASVCYRMHWTTKEFGLRKKIVDKLEIVTLPDRLKAEIIMTAGYT